MSHTSTVKSIKIQSISALSAAVAELNANGIICSLKEKATPRAYYTGQAGMGEAPYVLHLPAATYDVGLYLSEDGKSYEARTDFFGGSVERLLGTKASSPESREQARMGKLFQLYGVHAATEAARRKGHSVRRVTGTDGKIKLEITGSGL